MKIGEFGDAVPLLLFPATLFGLSAALLLRLSFVSGGVALPSLLLLCPECTIERGDPGSKTFTSGGGVVPRGECRIERGDPGSKTFTSGGGVAPRGE